MLRDVAFEYEAKGGGLATTGPRRQNLLLAGCLMREISRGFAIWND